MNGIVRRLIDAAPGRTLVLAPLIALVLLAACSPVLDAQVTGTRRVGVTLLPDEERQVIHGFGASDAWSIQFVGRNWPLEKRERIADLLFSTELDASGSPRGIGLTIWRFNIGGGSAEQGDASGIADPWRRAESFLGPEGEWDASRHAGQRWFLEAARARGVERFIGFVNSPPVHLTKNGKAFSSGGESANLPPERYRAFAEYLRDVVRHLEASAGVRLDYVSPVNEPQWDWTGGQEGSPWLNTEIHALVGEIGRVFQEAGLTTGIEITESGKLNYLYEDADRPGRGDQIATFFDPASPLYLGDVPNVARKIAGHSYYTAWPLDTFVEVRRRLRERIQEIDPSLEFWMTEYCVLENNPVIRGNRRDLGMAAALWVARVIHADLAIAGASSWQWWLAVSPYDYKDGLVYIDRDPVDGEVHESKLLWTLGHFSRFVRPGMRRIETRRSDGVPVEAVEDDLLVTAYRDPATGALVAVLVNQGEGEMAVELDAGAPRSFRYYVTTDAPGDDLRFAGAVGAGDDLVLPPRSIVTAVSD